MDEYELEDAYDSESDTIALEGEFNLEALEKIVEWLKQKHEWIP